LTPPRRVALMRSTRKALKGLDGRCKSPEIHRTSPPPPGYWLLGIAGVVLGSTSERRRRLAYPGCFFSPGVTVLLHQAIKSDMSPRALEIFRGEPFNLRRVCLHPPHFDKHGARWDLYFGGPEALRRPAPCARYFFREPSKDPVVCASLIGRFSPRARLVR